MIYEMRSFSMQQDYRIRTLLSSTLKVVTIDLRSTFRVATPALLYPQSLIECAARALTQALPSSGFLLNLFTGQTKVVSATEPRLHDR